MQVGRIPGRYSLGMYVGTGSRQQDFVGAKQMSAGGERCTKYVPGVQEFSKVGIRGGAVVKTGVRQGSVLSPLLFVLLMDQVPKQAAREMVSEGDHSGTFAYADDISLETCSATELQQPIDIRRDVLTNIGLKLNAAKAEVTVVSRQSERLHNDAGGRELKQAEQFKYLGSHVRQHSH
jgi:Reverse transcriptase (RNA-dependent DNA polymerase)